MSFCLELRLQITPGFPKIDHMVSLGDISSKGGGAVSSKGATGNKGMRQQFETYTRYFKVLNEEQKKIIGVVRIVLKFKLDTRGVAWGIKVL